VEDCLKRVSNRFLLVNMAAKRVRQIREGSEYLVSSPKNEDIVIALREIAAGKVNLHKVEEAPKELTEQTNQKELAEMEKTEPADQEEQKDEAANT